MVAIPEIATQLLEKFSGSKSLAADAAGIHKTTFGKIARGQLAMSDLQRGRIEKALRDAPAAKPKRKAPRSTEEIKADGPLEGKIDKRPKGQRTKIEYNDPPLLAQLIAMYNGRRNRAAAAMGFATPTTMNQWALEPSTFDQFAELRVQRALKGEPPPSGLGEEEPDGYKLGLSIGLFPAANFERALDAAEAFGGKCIFKVAVRTEWLGVFKLQQDKAKLFKKLMIRDAIRITCP